MSQRISLKSDETAFFPTTYYTVDGETVMVPTYSLRKDFIVRQRLGVLLDEYKEETSARTIGGWLTSIVSISDNRIGDGLIDLGSIILEKDIEWVENNLTVSDIVSLVVSFCYASEEAEASDESDDYKDDEDLSFVKVIEFFCSKYSWSPEQVLDLSKWQIRAIITAYNDRMEEEQEAMDNPKGRQGTKGARRRSMNPAERCCINPLDKGGRETVKRAKKGEQWGTESLVAFMGSRGGIKKGGDKT